MHLKYSDYNDQNRLNNLSEKYNIHGFNYTLIKSGTASATRAYGLKNTAPAEEMRPDTIFEAASLTKSLFATLVLRLVDRGVFTLDEKISELAPDIKITGDDRIKEVTIRQVLSHSTGLPNWGNKPELEFLFDPGTDFSYSGEGYYYLQKIVDEVTGKDFCAHFNDEFIRPLNMENSVPVWDKTVPERESHKFSEDGKLVELRQAVDTSGNAPEPNAAWSLYSGAEDYSKFMLEILNDKGHLSESMFKEMISPQSKATSKIYWGLGWGIPVDDPNVIWHWGDNGGYRHLSVMDTETKDGMCIFTNGFGGIDLSIEFLGLVADNNFGQDIVDFIRTAEA
jgi:CubicO group peptidase (beta-lactamase class C family)